MPRIVGIELFELDLPLRQPFRHAAAERSTSGSIFARFTADTGHAGYGETLPRPYVTGEERGATFDLLAQQILPRVMQMEFSSFSDLHDFLVSCDGKAPPGWVDPAHAQSAAWCLVDLGLLDTITRSLGTSVSAEFGKAYGPPAWPPHLRYSVVLSGGSGRRSLVTLLKCRLFGIRDVKVKADGGSVAGVRLARRVLGRKARLRVDSNMAWSVDQAREVMPRMAAFGVESFEQPLPADDLDALAHLVRETDLAVMADESLVDAASLEALIDLRACTAVNVRISKCGGLVASLARCRRAVEAGLTLQVGCQVGETSQLSAAQWILIGLAGGSVRYAEGSFGERLLRLDPVRPLLQFGRGGRPPEPIQGLGFGTEGDLEIIRRHSHRHVILGGALHHPVTTGA